MEFAYIDTFCCRLQQDNMEEAEEWEQWQDGDVDISSSDGNAMGSDSDDSMYSEGAGGARTRAQRRGRRADKRPRPSPDRRGQRARKRQRLQRSQYAEGGSDEEEEFEEVLLCSQHVLSLLLSAVHSKLNMHLLRPSRSASMHS